MAILKIILVVVALVVTAFTILGLIGMISPTTYLHILDALPSEIGEQLFVDYILKGGTSFWVSLAAAVILWWLVSKIK